MASNKQFIKFDPRAYNHIRQTTIQDIGDVLVELITNSSDAYERSTFDRKPIDVKVDYVERTVMVRDQAIGLSGYEMEGCFLQVGKYTSTEQSRGFFSRGAKDITALGDATFESIKNGMYSRCFVDTDACGEMQIVDQPVTVDIRDRLGIVANGTIVTLKTGAEHRYMVQKKLVGVVTNHYALRGILSDPLYQIRLCITGNHRTPGKYNSVSYTTPEGELILNVDYEVNKEVYPGVVANFKLYKSKSAINPVRNRKLYKHGFLIKSGASIHEVTLFEGFSGSAGICNNPYNTYMFGEITCDHINKLMYDLDINGKTASNPMPIIDPSRRTGLIRKHPFAKNLVTIPILRTRQILLELDRAANDMSLEAEDVSDLMRQLNMVGNDIVRSNKLNDYIPSTYGKLIRAIEDTRGESVLCEQFFAHKVFKPRVNPTDEITSLLGKVKSKVSAPIDHGYLYKRDDNGILKRLLILDNGTILSKEEEEESTDKKPIMKVYAERKVLFKLSFTQSDLIKYRYQIYFDGTTIHLRINMKDPFIKTYIGENEMNNNNIASLTSGKAGIVISEIMIEAFSRILMDRSLNNKEITLDGDPQSNMNTVFVNYEKNVSKIQMLVHELMKRYVATNKMVKTEALNTIMTSLDTKKDEILLHQVMLEESMAVTKTNQAEMDAMLNELKTFVSK